MTQSYRKVFASFLFIFVLMLGSSAWAEPGEVFETKLDNGLTVLIEEEHTAPVVSVQMWVKVGSGDETDKEAGISHVFEHMLFKGTEKRAVGQIANIIESVGGDINAYTSFDNTVFHLVVPSRHFATGLDIVSDAIQHSSFDPEELKKELEVVLEELRMNDDSPERSLYKHLLAASYAEHPYRRPVIGYIKTVKSFTREDILKFFDKWYVPNNMTLVITGDIKKDDALKAVKEEFKNFKKAPDPHKKRPVEPEQKQLRTEIVPQQITETHIGAAFHIPSLKDEDTYSLDVLSVILGGGESSRLYKKLKVEEATVYDIGSYPMSLVDPGLFIINANLKAANVDKAIAGSFREIRRLGYEGPNHEEIEKAKLNLESDFIYQRETMQGIASKLGYYETNLGDYNYEKKYIEGIRKVTPDDVKRVVNKYLTAANMTITALVPKNEKAPVTKDGLFNSVKTADETAKKEFAEEKEAPEKITKVKLENGITLIIKESHANPTVAFYAAFPGGLRFETREKNGIGNFTAEMITRGTTKRTREELSREVEEMAGGVGGFSGWNSTGANGKFLSMYFDKGLGIFADIILNPVFPEDEIEKLRVDIQAAIKRQEDYLPGYTFKLLYKELYRTHPYGMPVIGTKETVTGINRDDLVKHHQEFFVPERMILTIVGDVNRDYAIERVKALFKDFKRTGKPLVLPPAEKHQETIRTTGEVKEKAQSNIGIGFLGVALNNKDRYALKVLTEVLSGQSGRLFIDLRDKQSLAYSLSAMSKEGVDPGIFAVYIGSAPEKKDAAIAGIFKELKDVTTEKITADELNRAKNSLIGGYEIGLQEVSNQAADMTNNELYGFGFDFYKHYAEKVNAVTADDVLRAAKKYITLDAYTISVVGPNGKAGAEKAAESAEKSVTK